MRNELEQKLKGSVSKFKGEKDIEEKGAPSSDINKLKEEKESNQKLNDLVDELNKKNMELQNSLKDMKVKNDKAIKNLKFKNSEISNQKESVNKEKVDIENKYKRLEEDYINLSKKRMKEKGYIEIELKN